MILSKLGIITDEVSQDLNVALNWVQNNGLKHVEIRMVNDKNISDLSDDDVDNVLKEVEKRNLSISCVASPLFKCALDPSRAVATGDTFGQDEENIADHFTKLDRMIEICKRLKTDKIRIFSFWREEHPGNHINEIVTHLKRAAEIAEKEGIILLLENEASCNGGFASEVGEIVAHVNSSHLKVLWDPGNEVHGGRSAFPEGYNEVKNLIGHVHLKDAKVDANGNGYCVPIGAGHVLFKDHIIALEKDGYDGLYTIETHYIPKDGTPMEGSQMTLEGLNKVLDDIKS